MRRSIRCRHVSIDAVTVRHLSNARRLPSFAPGDARYSAFQSLTTSPNVRHKTPALRMFQNLTHIFPFRRPYQQPVNTQSRQQFAHVMHPPQPVRAIVAFGSNVGDRLQIIEDACRLLDSTDGIRLLRTSGLWETKAMYVTDQADFLNGVCEIETTLEAHDLLDRLQSIENDMGRKRKVDKGPRTLDLDITLYGDSVIETERLSVPHKLMLEREFVLRPLCQLLPDGHLPSNTPIEGQTAVSFSTHLAKLPASEQPAQAVTPLTPSLNLTPSYNQRSTHVMSILNVTPDSFSDGGLHSASDPTALESTIRAHLTSGATLLDVGGQSTRPHAEPISADEEISRVVPAIKLIRSIISSPSSPTTNVPAISIDTYRASVARAAIEAGADLVNDVSAGTLDDSMLSTVAELDCSVILMHMRGDPSNMMSKENTSYPEGLIPTIGAELLARVQAAEAAGVRRWRMVLDPGIGFAKTTAQNLEILRRFDELKAFPGLEGFAWMVGASRKGFVGKITGVKEASERSWGTAVTVAASVQGGADIVRVHDVDEMAKVVLMADAIWRP